MSYFSKDLTRGKLVVLYFLHKTGLALSEEQLMRIVIENNWLDYFSMQIALSEMHENDLIMTKHGKTNEYIVLTEKGKTSVSSFFARLPQSLRDEIDQYASENRRAMQEYAQYTAVYQLLEDGCYQVELKILEQEIVIYALSLRIASRESAQTLCNRWEATAQEVYTNTLQLLTT